MSVYSLLKVLWSRQCCHQEPDSSPHQQVRLPFRTRAAPPPTARDIRWWRCRRRVGATSVELWCFRGWWRMCFWAGEVAPEPNEALKHSKETNSCINFHLKHVNKSGFTNHSSDSQDEKSLSQQWRHDRMVWGRRGERLHRWHYSETAIGRWLCSNNRTASRTVQTTSPAKNIAAQSNTYELLTNNYFKHNYTSVVAVSVCDIPDSSVSAIQTSGFQFTITRLIGGGVGARCAEASNMSESESKNLRRGKYKTASKNWLYMVSLRTLW